MWTQFLLQLLHQPRFWSFMKPLPFIKSWQKNHELIRYYHLRPAKTAVVVSFVAQPTDTRTPLILACWCVVCGVGTHESFCCIFTEKPECSWLLFIVACQLFTHILFSEFVISAKQPDGITRRHGWNQKTKAREQEGKDKAWWANQVAAAISVMPATCSGHLQFKHLPPKYISTSNVRPLGHLPSICSTGTSRDKTRAQGGSCPLTPAGFTNAYQFLWL